MVAQITTPHSTHTGRAGGVFSELRAALKAKYRRWGRSPPRRRTRPGRGATPPVGTLLPAQFAPFEHPPILGAVSGKAGQPDVSAGHRRAQWGGIVLHGIHHCPSEANEPAPRPWRTFSIWTLPPAPSQLVPGRKPSLTVPPNAPPARDVGREPPASHPHRKWRPPLGQQSENSSGPPTHPCAPGDGTAARPEPSQVKPDGHKGGPGRDRTYDRGIMSPLL